MAGKARAKSIRVYPLDMFEILNCTIFIASVRNMTKPLQTQTYMDEPSLIGHKP
jgi:hypothetical protein